MLVEQRHVTTVNLQDGKARDFVVFRDPRGCKVSCVARDEVVNVVLSYQDFQRLCQAVVRPHHLELVKETAADGEGGAPGGEGGPAWGSIRVEQRQVTTVALHPSRPREFTLGRDDRGCKLSSVARDEVVTILLSQHDFQKLRQQMAKWEWRDVRKEPVTAITAVPPAAESCEVSVPAMPAVAATAYPWGGIDWLGFN